MKLIRGRDYKMNKKMIVKVAGKAFEDTRLAGKAERELYAPGPEYLVHLSKKERKGKSYSELRKMRIARAK